MNHRIHTLALGPMDNLLHIIEDTNSQQAFVVDPAWDVEAILNYLDRARMTVKGILLTHSHIDHVNGVDELLESRDVPVYLSRTEFELGKVALQHPHFVASGDKLLLGETTIEVIETPGHTVGSLCFYTEPSLIVGDTLFIDGCGRCNFPESDVERMWDSLQHLKTLPDTTLIYCGHHYGQKTVDTLAKQKQTNPYLLIEDKAFFIDFRMDLQSQYRSIPFQRSSSEEIQIIYQKHYPA